MGSMRRIVLRPGVPGGSTPLYKVSSAAESTPVGLTDRQKSDYTQVDERHFLKIQRKLFSVGLDLLLQFIHVLRLKTADQADRRLAMRRMLFNLQG